MLVDKQGQSISDGVNRQLLSELMPRDDGNYNFFHTEIQRLTGLLDERWNIVLPAKYQFLGPYPADSDPKGLAWAGSSSTNFHQGFVIRLNHRRMIDKDHAVEIFEATSAPRLLIRPITAGLRPHS
jgi:hypothetical protein